MAILLSQLALFWAQLPQPLHKYSLLVLAISLFIAMLSIRPLWLWIQSLTVFRLLKFTFTLYIISVLVMAISTTGEDGFVRALSQSATQIPSIVARQISSVIGSMLRYPVDFSHAYNRRESTTSIDAILANESTMLDVNLPSSTSNEQPPIGRGMLVTMNSQAKNSCQLDALSDETFFTTNDALMTEGPRYQDNLVWWRLRNQLGTAWCPSNVLSTP